MSGYNAFIACKPYMGNYQYTGYGSFDSRYSTYSTGVAGIGVRIGYASGSGTDAGWWVGTTVPDGSASWNFAGGARFRVELVKTGPITAGGMLGGDIGRLRMLDHGQDVMIVRLAASVPIKPLVPSCRVSSNANFLVPMGGVTIGTLQRDGISPGQRFDIQLQCSGGTQGATTRMYMGMTDSSNPANRSDVLGLANGSKATGVGIRIFRDGDTPVSFGPDSTAAGTPNQWPVGQYGNVAVNIPFRAHYVRTGGAITAGSANGVVTYTISYQ